MRRRLIIRLIRPSLVFIDLAAAAKYYPCAKKALIEFLEESNPATERIE